MKTAVLYSGHMRSFERCLPTHLDHVFRHFPGADFFVSTVRDADSHTAELLRERAPNARVEIEVIDAQPEIPVPAAPTSPDWTLGRLYTHEPYAISVHPQAVLRQLWHLNRVWEFMLDKTIAENEACVCKYDVVIRIRPDNYFRSCEWMSPQGPFPVPPANACTPCWGRFGGINDRFAILGSEAAKAYFTTFTRIKDLLAKGYPLHPERLVYASLVESGCDVDDTLQAWFSKLNWGGKDHGTFRDPEVTEVDRAHWALAR